MKDLFQYLCPVHAAQNLLGFLEHIVPLYSQESGLNVIFFLQRMLGIVFKPIYNSS